MAGSRSRINSAERMLNLMALLGDSASPLTLEEIMNRMGAQYADGAEARRIAFERDKKVLRKLGVPITTQTLGGNDAGKTAYSIDRTGYALIDFGLTADEMDALQQAAAMVQIGTPWGRQAVQWLGGEVGTAHASSAVAVEAGSTSLPVLWDAVADGRPATFSYHDRFRTVHPYGLIARNGFWYLVAFDTERSAQVTFRVDRIDGDITVGQPGTFQRPADFDLATAYNRDPKQFTSAGGETAVVRIDAGVAPTVVSELGQDSVVAERPDGSVDVEVACGNQVAFRSWLYALVDRAEVVSPAHVREAIIQDLGRMAGGTK